MKNAFLAFTLSFFLPGAGLWYLGWRGWAVVNLLAVLAIGAIASLAFPEIFEKYTGVIAAGCGGGSGGIAQTLAQRHNLMIKTQGQTKYSG